jgi:hypothetical protein
LCVSSRYLEQWVGNAAGKKSWCVEYQNLMPLATDKYNGNVFQFMKSEELMAGEDSKPAGMCSELVGTHFFNWKNKILMKIPEFKRSKIGMWNSERISQPRMTATTKVGGARFS